MQPHAIYLAQDDVETSAIKRMRYSKTTPNALLKNVSPSRTWQCDETLAFPERCPDSIFATPAEDFSNSDFGQLLEQSSADWLPTAPPGPYSNAALGGLTYPYPTGTNDYAIQAGNQPYYGRYSTTLYSSTELSASCSHPRMYTSPENLTSDLNLPIYGLSDTQVTTPASGCGDNHGASSFSAVQTSQQLHDYVASSQFSSQENQSQLGPRFTDQVQLPACTGASTASTNYQLQ